MSKITSPASRAVGCTRIRGADQRLPALLLGLCLTQPVYSSQALRLTEEEGGIPTQVGRFPELHVPVH